jgi:hypothetical protein
MFFLLGLYPYLHKDRAGHFPAFRMPCSPLLTVLSTARRSRPQPSLTRHRHNSFTNTRASWCRFVRRDHGRHGRSSELGSVDYRACSRAQPYPHVFHPRRHRRVSASQTVAAPAADAQPYPDPAASFPLMRFGGKSIFVARNVCYRWAGASGRQKLKAWSVLVYPAIPDVDRDAEGMSELAGSAD